MSEVKSHNTAVFGFENGTILFLKTFDYENEKEEAQATLEFVQKNYKGWYISTLEQWELTSKMGNEFYNFKLPNHE